ncbi:MAG TPA: ABC transporter permease [Candidatus Baltobacteraceae bacterium]|nr:ABC transporter permease [Candidatus Baltobacteraceae bacterium]
MLRDLFIVYRAEILRRIQSRPFLIGLIIGGLGIAGLAKLPAFMSSHVTNAQARVVLGGAPRLTAEAALLLGSQYDIAGIQTSVTPPSLRELDRLRAGRFIALANDRNGLRVTVYSTDAASVNALQISRLLLPLRLELGAHVDQSTAKRLAAFKVNVVAAAAKQSLAQVQFQRAVALTFILFLYLLVVLNSQLTMAGVIEEKTNRIAELLIASVDPLALLYGKILAGATLGFAQMIVWIMCAIAAGASNPHAASTGAPAATPFNLGGPAAAALTLTIFGAFVFFLIVGLLQFSTLFASMGSLISRPEDLGSINAAMILPIIAALILAMTALDVPNAPIVVATSFIPLFAPFTMFARIATDQPPIWQIGLSAGINAIAVVVIAIVAGRLYRVGMLLYGRPPTLRQVWITLRG